MIGTLCSCLLLAAMLFVLGHGPHEFVDVRLANMGCGFFLILAAICGAICVILWPWKRKI